MTLSDLYPRPFVEKEDGVFSLEDSAYRKTPGLSQSMLKVLLRSPAHYLSELRKVKVSTPAQVIGTLTDHAILEPERFEGAFHVRPEGMKFTTTEGKVWKEVHGDRPIIDADDFRNIKGMIDSVLCHPVASKMIELSYKQASIFCGHGPTNIRRKGRPDLLLTTSRGRPTIGDLKTTEDGSPQEFAKSIAQWGYHVQDAYYSQILEDIFAERPAFLFITVEKEDPWCCTVYQLDDEGVEEGHRLCCKALDTYAKCLDSGTWPGYSTDVETLRLPPWAINPRPAIVPDWILD